MSRLQDGKWVDDGEFKSPTRAQYLNGDVTFSQFYGAIARESGISFAKSDLLPRIVRCLEAGDYHLNNIPLATWDGYSIMAKHATDPVLRAHGNWWSIAGGTCIAKEAAREAVANDNYGWASWIAQAVALSTTELRRHASVSRDNRHQCRECFCCAAAEVLENDRKHDKARVLA